MTKLCIITPFPPEQDGLAIYAKRFVDAFLLKPSASVAVFCPPSAGEAIYTHSRNNLEMLRIWRPRSLTSLLQIWRGIVNRHPDIVDLQYGPFGKYGGLIGEPLVVLILLLRLSRLRVILTLHSVWSPREAMKRAFERTKNRILSYVAGVYYWMFMLLLLRLPSRTLLVVTFEHSPVTKSTEKLFRLPSQRLREIVHGTLPPLCNTTQRLSSKRNLQLFGKRVFLIFGFIRRDKGIELALRSMNELRGANMLIVAGTPLTDDDRRYLAYLKTLTLELKLVDHVRFDTRFIPEDDLREYLNAADVLLLPYTRRVGPSGPLATAASFGLPVIAVYDGKWLADSDSFVYLVRKADHKELLQAMKGIDVKGRVMVKEAIGYASKYSFKNQVEQYSQLVLDE